ncbi:MAG: sigma-70 family RNA polymerase sigma factor [Myxococcales bacterium]|nr:sigma-70 family RNA polymerase sigma factor [Myxococcales bacterium]
MDGSDRRPEDATLLGRVAARDPAAVRACIAQYGPLVWSLARRFEPTDAEDAVQEVFLDLWKHAGRFDAQLGSEAAFIVTIARRRLIDRQRMRSRRPTTEAMPEKLLQVDPTTSPVVAAEAAQAARVLEQLRPEQREVIVLATCYGLSHGEIAEQTGMPLGTVKAHVRRGLLMIRSALLGVQPQELP